MKLFFVAFLGATLCAITPCSAETNAIPPLKETESIQVSSTNSDSAAYLEIDPSGVIMHVPWRSSMHRYPPGSRRTIKPVVRFEDVYRDIARVAVGGGSSSVTLNADARLVYFHKRGAGSAEAVHVPAQHKELVSALFKAFEDVEYRPVDER